MDGKNITKALENAVESVIQNAKEAIGTLDPDLMIVEKAYIENMADELATYRQKRDDMGKEKLTQTPAIYTIVNLLRERFKLDTKAFPDNEIAAAWSGVQGFPIPQQMEYFCDMLGIPYQD